MASEPEDLAPTDRFAEQFALIHQARPEQVTEGLEKANEILEMLLGHEIAPALRPGGRQMMAGKWRLEAQSMAMKVRAEAGIGQGLIADVFDLLELLDVLFLRYPMGEKAVEGFAARWASVSSSPTAAIPGAKSISRPRTSWATFTSTCQMTASSLTSE